MSYDNYGHYSPYWQPPAGQTTPQNFSHDYGKSGNSFKPLSAYQNSQQPSQAAPSERAARPAGAYGNQGYGTGNMNGAGNVRPHDSMASFTDANDRASVDGARALGNLAYASSLSRDASVPQALFNGLQKNNATYGSGNSYGPGPALSIEHRSGDERRSSNGSSREEAARLQQATASPSFGYSANDARYQGPSTGSNTQAHLQYPHPSPATTERHKNQYSQISRPPSSQAVQQPRPRPGSQAAPSPTPSANQNQSSQGQLSKSSSSVTGKAETRVTAPQSGKRQSISQGPKELTQISQSPQATTSSQVDSNSKGKAVEYSSARENATQRVNEVRQSPIVDPGRDQNSKPATPAEPHYSTVDPSQVFNYAEYSRRQAAAVKKAAEAEALRSSATQPNVAASQVNGSELESSKRDQMELEMKQMLEKMRDYKAKDPSLFTEIWEQVKKGQPPQRTPSKLFQGSATSPVVVNVQPPSPGMIETRLPSETDLPTGDEFPPNFDRGRFPAQRRRRGNKAFSVSRNSTTPKGSAKPAAKSDAADDNAAQNDSSETRKSSVAPEIAIPKVGQIFPDPGSHSITEAMQQFHHDSTAPVVNAQQMSERYKQATTTTPQRPPKVITHHPQPASAQPAPAQPASGQSAPPPISGGTYWPESQKKALAEAARIALTSSPRNKGKPITTQEIHELLDQNPSYNLMCEILEYRGFVIDRGHFARILLKAVPDLGSASRSANATSVDTANADRPTPTTSTVPALNNNTATKATSATPNTGTFGTLVKMTPDGSTAPTKATQPFPYALPPAAAVQAPNTYVTPYPFAPPSAEQASERHPINGPPRDYHFVNPASWSANQPRHHANLTDTNRPTQLALNSHPSFPSHQYPVPVNGQSSGQNKKSCANDVIPHHPNKQELARKRTFAEIVDLTQPMSDDEELERHRPKPRTDNEGTSASSKSVKSVFNHVAQRQQNSGKSTPKPFEYKYSGRDALLQSRDIIKPMNKRRDALRRSTYNSKTIARDVLLGIGRHPTMAPLNAHLDVLKDRFKAVDFYSDLSTFRWDLVDPEGEASAELSSTGDEVVVPAVAAVAHQSTAPIAVMVDSNDSGLAENNSALSHTLSSGNPNRRGPYKTSGNPSGVQSTGSANTPHRQSSQSSPSTQKVGDVRRTNTQDLTRFAYDSPYTVHTDFTPLNPSSLSTPGSTLKRKGRGRPPSTESKQVLPKKGISKKIKPPSGAETPSTAKDKKLEKDKLGRSPSGGKTPSTGNFTTEKPSVLMPTRPHPIITTPSRPSSLKNSISAITPKDGIAVVISSRSPSVVLASPQTPVRKAKPKRTEGISNDTDFSAPSYTVYQCQWENCPAKLHNLETLKKHVRKHRRAVDGVYPCLWADCSDNSKTLSHNMHNGDSRSTRSSFKTDAEWAEHVECSHLTMA